MSRPSNKPHRCGSCGELGQHNSRTCSTRLPDGQRRCSCGEVFTITNNPKQLRCLPCNRLYQKLWGIKRAEQMEKAS